MHLFIHQIARVGESDGASSAILYRSIDKAMSLALPNLVARGLIARLVRLSQAA
jgi:hypothetical protein